MRRAAKQALVAVTTAAVLLGAAGCVRMPESGPVVGTGSEGRADDLPGVFIDPKPPEPGANPADIVTGFLDAMTATPLQTNAAKQFLTRDAQAAWTPEAETITYSEASPPRGGLRVSVTLGGARHLDGRGAYLGRLPAEDRSLTFPMASEDGEWRIARAPDALIVPDSWFEQRFRQVSLYFFDPSGQILVPEPVFVPRGEQLATALTSALLRGPGPALEDISRSFIPEGLSFGLSVPVSEEGVADLALRGFSGRLTPDASEQMLAQLAWTLRQEPAIQELRVSVGGQRITLSGGESLFDVDQQGAEYDPTVLGASTLLYGLRGGRLVSGTPDSLAPVDGPMGVSRLGVRSVAVDLTADQVVGVSAGGDSLLRTSVRNQSDRVESVVSGARGLLRPAWDFNDRVWLVDNGPGGARVSYLSGKLPTAGPGARRHRTPGRPLHRVPGRVAPGRGRPGRERRPGDDQPDRPRRPGPGDPGPARHPHRLGGRQPAPGQRPRLELNHLGRRAAPIGQAAVPGAHHPGGRLPARPGQPPDHPPRPGDRTGRLSRAEREPVRGHPDRPPRPDPGRTGSRRRSAGPQPSLRRLREQRFHRSAGAG